MEKPTLISLYSGCGGSAKGFQIAGFKIVFMNDINKDACESLRINFKNGRKAEMVHHGDIKTRGIIEKIKELEETDVIEGGFPCQGFSMAGPRNVDDKRNMLYKHLKQAIKDVKPKFFVAENVKGFVSIGEKPKDVYNKRLKKWVTRSTGPFFKDGKIIKLGKTAKAIIDELGKIGKGYNVQCQLLNAKDYGLPQDRERIFIVGVRKDLGIEFEFPEPTHGPNSPKKQKYETMEGFGVKAFPVNAEDEFFREEKGDKKDYFGSRYMSRNRVKEFNDVSFTIPAEAQQVPAQPGSKMWKTKDGKPPGDIKPIDKAEKDTDPMDWTKFRKDHADDISEELKRLSYMQCAKIQGFPDEWEFFGEKLTSKYRQIGNAVPPPLMEKIAAQIMHYLVKEKVTA